MPLSICSVSLKYGMVRSMTKRDKRLEGIRQNPKNVSFDELKQALEDYGFIMRPSKGSSHHFFRAEINERVWSLTIPFRKPHIKLIYVKKALNAIDEIIALQPTQEDEDNHGES